MINKKHFHPKETEYGIRVLFPNYRLEYDETVVFSLRRVLFVSIITQKGIGF